MANPPDFAALQTGTDNKTAFPPAFPPPPPGGMPGLRLPGFPPPLPSNSVHQKTGSAFPLVSQSQTGQLNADTSKPNFPPQPAMLQGFQARFGNFTRPPTGSAPPVGLSLYSSSPMSLPNVSVPSSAAMNISSTSGSQPSSLLRNHQKLEADAPPSSMGSIALPGQNESGQQANKTLPFGNVSLNSQAPRSSPAMSSAPKTITDFLSEWTKKNIKPDMADAEIDNGAQDHTTPTDSRPIPTLGGFAGDNRKGPMGSHPSNVGMPIRSLAQSTPLEGQGPRPLLHMEPPVRGLLRPVGPHAGPGLIVVGPRGPMPGPIMAVRPRGIALQQFGGRMLPPRFGGPPGLLAPRGMRPDGSFGFPHDRFGPPEGVRRPPPLLSHDVKPYGFMKAATQEFEPGMHPAGFEEGRYTSHPNFREGSNRPDFRDRQSHPDFGDRLAGRHEFRDGYPGPPEFRQGPPDHHDFREPLSGRPEFRKGFPGPHNFREGPPGPPEFRQGPPDHPEFREGHAGHPDFRDMQNRSHFGEGSEFGKGHSDRNDFRHGPDNPEGNGQFDGRSDHNDMRLDSTASHQDQNADQKSFRLPEKQTPESDRDAVLKQESKDSTYQLEEEKQMASLGLPLSFGKDEEEEEENQGRRRDNSSRRGERDYSERGGREGERGRIGRGSRDFGIRDYDRGGAERGGRGRYSRDRGGRDRYGRDRDRSDDDRRDRFDDHSLRDRYRRDDRRDDRDKVGEETSDNRKEERRERDDRRIDRRADRDKDEFGRDRRDRSPRRDRDIDRDRDRDSERDRDRRSRDKDKSGDSKERDRDFKEDKTRPDSNDDNTKAGSTERKPNCEKTSEQSKPSGWKSVDSESDVSNSLSSSTWEKKIEPAKTGWKSIESFSDIHTSTQPKLSETVSEQSKGSGWKPVESATEIAKQPSIIGKFKPMVIAQPEPQAEVVSQEITSMLVDDVSKDKKLEQLPISGFGSDNMSPDIMPVHSEPPAVLDTASNVDMFSLASETNQLSCEQSDKGTAKPEAAPIDQNVVHTELFQCNQNIAQPLSVENDTQMVPAVDDAQENTSLIGSTETDE